MTLLSTRRSTPPATTVRVASVPSGHVYVRHLDDVTPDDGVPDDGAQLPVVRIPDPRPTPDAPAGQWWPPAMLDPDWIERNAGEFDVFHLHFGFDALSPTQLRDVVASLRRAGKPLVHTVHDLRNPHHDTPAAHDAALDVLVAEADALITLTNGAAQVIERRWGRDAHVVPHPHVLDLDRITPRPPRPTGEFVVGLHAKSLRRSMRPLGVLRALLPLDGELPGLRLRFDVHHDVVTPGAPRFDADLTAAVSEAAAAGVVDLHVHDFFTDDELWAYLGSLDLSVLPYRFGTHSGWLEACHDLGTAVAAPTCGFYAEQHPVLTYRHDEDGLDGESLRDVVRRAHAERPVVQATREGRTRERRDVAAAHARIYADVLR